jgi:hypothetical protein
MRCVPSLRPRCSPALLLGLSAALLAATPALAEDPPARKVLEDAVAAMGGKEAVARIETLHLVSEMSTMGMTMGLEAYWAKDGSRFIRQYTPEEQAMPGMSMPEMVAGSDGTVRWMKNPMNGQYTLMEEGEFDELEQQALLHMRLLRMDETAKEDFESCENQGRSEFSGRACHKLHVVGKDKEVGDLYFDVENGLPLGFEMSQEDGPMGPAKGTFVIADWRTIDGLKFFQSVTMSIAMGQMTQQVAIKFPTIEVNGVDRKVFELPAAVKELASKQSASADKRLEDFTPQQQAEIKQMLAGLESTTSKAQLEAAIRSLEQSRGFLPADKKETFDYVLREAKKRLDSMKG